MIRADHRGAEKFDGLQGIPTSESLTKLKPRDRKGPLVFFFTENGP